MITPAPERTLLLTPITSADTGNGLAMRAHAIQCALASLGTVDTVVIPVAEVALNSTVIHSREAAASWLQYSKGRELLQKIDSLPSRVRLAPPLVTQALALGEPYDRVYVLRLYLAGAVLPLMKQWTDTLFLLDRDEDDAQVIRQIGALLEADGESGQAEKQYYEAELLERFATACTSWFDLVAYSSQVEASASSISDERVLILPNTIHSADNPSPAPPSTRLLFLGNLNYPPNHDALKRVLVHILPTLRLVDTQAELVVVGAGGNALQRQHSDDAGVTWLGFLPKISEAYSNITALIAPLRAGGGSRIKVLEAMAHGVPVIASAKGLEGLDVEHDRHVLVADTDEAFRLAILRLSQSATLRSKLVEEAASYIQREHNPAYLPGNLEFAFMNHSKSIKNTGN
ncbi:MAG: glycosyltransferase involved in cell wall biosynthesis [Halieaceae bacterium]|jgi:glycosyltransferase involved in cell wall biosynthesis